MVKKMLRTRGGFSGRAGITAPRKTTSTGKSAPRFTPMPKVGKAAVAAASNVSGVLSSVSSAQLGVLNLAKLMIYNDVAKGQDSAILGKVGSIAQNLGEYLSKRGKAKANALPGAEDLKIVASDNGIGAFKGSYVGLGVGNSSARIIKFKDSYYDGPKDSKLILARKLYGSTTVNYFSTEKTVYNRLYAYSGLNVKGLFDPYRGLALSVPYTSIDNASVVAVNLSPSSNLGETIADTAVMLREGLLGNVGTPNTPTEMPRLLTGDIDYYYPIQSWKSVLRIMNTNSFLPCTVKVYTVQARRDTSQSPHEAWYDLTLTEATQPIYMDDAYIEYQETELISGLSGSPRTTVNLHPQATPGMSSNFKDQYRILSVRTFVLKASDQLEYEFTRHFGQSHSAASYNQTAMNNYRRAEGQIDFMIEFQGPPTPYYKTTTSGAVLYSGLSHCSFSKIRVTVDKSFVHSLPISYGTGLYNPTSSTYTPSFVGSRQIPLLQYDDTASYTNFATASTTVAGKYVVPIVSNETRQSAQPQISDPV